MVEHLEGGTSHFLKFVVEESRREPHEVPDDVFDAVLAAHRRGQVMDARLPQALHALIFTEHVALVPSVLAEVVVDVVVEGRRVVAKEAGRQPVGEERHLAVAVPRENARVGLSKGGQGPPLKDES